MCTAGRDGVRDGAMRNRLLAAAEDLIAGTEGAAVDAAALKEAMATAQPAGDYMPLDLSTLPALP